jgi:hypothetical protein
MNADSFPTFRRFFRFIGRCLRRLRRIFLSRRSVVVYLIVITLGWLAITFERWQGRRAWASEKERLAAAGDTLEITRLLTPRPPDAENFFAIPELSTLGDPKYVNPDNDNPLELWLARRYLIQTDKQGRPLIAKSGRPYRKMTGSGVDELTGPLADLCAHFRKTGILPPQPLDPVPAKELLLFAQQKWQPLLEALYTASLRPSAVILPSPEERRLAGESPEVSGKAHSLLRMSRAIALHARVAIETGDGLLAEKDLRVLTKFEEALLNECGLRGLLYAANTRRFYLEVLRQGMQRHLWTAPQLGAFTAGSDPAAVWSSMRSALAVDRHIYCQRLMNSTGRDLQYITSDPDSVKLWRQLKTAYIRQFPEGPLLRMCVDASSDYAHWLAGLPASGTPLEGWPAHLKKLEATHPAASQSLIGVVRLLLFPWDRRRFVVSACALERHFLTHGRYPAALTGISPPLPGELLPDTDGQPLRYRTTADGAKFRLWSVGWDCKENTGAKNDDDVVFSTE